MSDNIINCFPFDSFRKYQKSLLKAIDTNFKEYNDIIVQAPTGIGKSPISISIIKHYGNGHVLTNQKSLQAQYLKDFDISKVDGRSNYYCINNSESTCDVGLCVADSKYKCPYKPSANHEPDNPDLKKRYFATETHDNVLYWNQYTDLRCPYWEQKIKAMNDNGVVHNYAYLLNEGNYVGYFGQRNVLICDEGHNIESHLLEFNQVTITKKDVDNIQQAYNSFEHNIEKWVGFLSVIAKKRLPDIITRLEQEIKEADKKISHLRGESKENAIARKSILIKSKQSKEKTIEKLQFFLFSASKNPDNWIMELEYDKESKNEIYKIVFKPIVISDYAEFQLFRFGKKRLIMSATILDEEIVAKNLGLENYLFINIDPFFEAENKPIYHLNIANFGGDALKETNPKNKIEEMVDAIDLILDVLNEKGIIHTTTYPIANMIKNRSRHSNRILIHNSENRQEIIDEHIKSDKKTVLCSPSMTEGLDLYDNLSRFQILVKVPYPDLSDIVIKAKKQLDDENEIPFNKSWYNWKTMIDVVQAYGRSIRNDDDYAFTFTLDSRFPTFCNQNAIKKTKTEYGGFTKEETLFAKSFNKYVRPFDEFLDMYDGQMRKLFEKAVMKHGRNTNWIISYL